MDNDSPGEVDKARMDEAWTGLILLAVEIGFPIGFYLTWPYSGLFFLAFFLSAGIYKEIRDAVRLRAARPERPD